MYTKNIIKIHKYVVLDIFYERPLNNFINFVIDFYPLLITLLNISLLTEIILCQLLM